MPNKPRIEPRIEDYALLSDRQTAALIADGSVDWLCLPRFDSASVFGRLLGDPDGSHWLIRPVGGELRGRAYRGSSFVLDTDWETDTGSARSTDFMPLTDRDDEISFVRTITCTRGRVDVESEIIVRFDYGRVTPWVQHLEDQDGKRVLHMLAGPDSLTFRGPLMEADDHRHRGLYSLEEGQSLTWTMTWRASHLPSPRELHVERDLERTLADWNEWNDAMAISGPYADAVSRSLAVLRALTLRSTGGIVAAATTSLPEAIGGERNWDYRYCWLRDSAFTISALVSHGHEHVAQHWRDWLLRAIAGDPDDLQIMYGVAGERRLPEEALDHLAGYEGSTPVRRGNGAVSQYQADVVGEVMLALANLRAAGMDEDEFSWPLQLNLLSLLEDRFDVPDHGIWEVRGDPHHFTHGRVMMWAAFHAGVTAVEKHGLDGPVKRWRDRRDRLRDLIMSNGVRDGHFVQHDESDQVDAALLQIPQTGFVAPDNPLMLATVQKIEDDLLDDHGFVRRYLTDGSDGLKGAEGSFLMCTFWLVEQYARSGRREDAVALMDKLLGVRNDLGLLAEEYDAKAGRLLGNVPQAFSHLALIRAADALAE